MGTRDQKQLGLLSLYQVTSRRSAQLATANLTLSYYTTDRIEHPSCSQCDNSAFAQPLGGGSLRSASLRAPGICGMSECSGFSVCLLLENAQLAQNQRECLHPVGKFVLNLRYEQRNLPNLLLYDYCIAVI
jgi:hypothetical protein